MTDMILYDVEQAVNQVKNTKLIVSEMRRDVLVVNVDYGIIPGTTKPTLLKPGAERLCTAFGLCPEFEPVTQIEDFENGIFYYRYRCSLVHIATGKKIATGIGSCNSKEDKYRWRNEECPNCHKQKILKSKFADKHTGEIGWYCGACKSNFPPDQFTGAREENTDPFSIINTLDKMAQKRALIAAVLIGTNASEFFTQDVEDLPHFNDDVIEAEYVEPGSNGSTKPDPKPAAAEKPAQPKGQATTEPPTTNGNGSKPSSPADNETLVGEVLAELKLASAKSKRGTRKLDPEGDIDKGMIANMGKKLGMIFKGHKVAFTKALWNVEHVEDMQLNQWHAVNDMIVSNPARFEAFAAAFIATRPEYGAAEMVDAATEQKVEA